MPVSSRFSKESKTVIINIDGRFDFSCHKSFRDAYKQYSEAQHKYELDMSKTDYVDSSALGMLLLLREHAGADAADIIIKNPREDVKEILEVSNFDRLFEIC